MVKFWKERVPAFESDEPSIMVTVPAVAFQVPEESTVTALLILMSTLAVRVPEAATVRLLNWSNWVLFFTMLEPLLKVWVPEADAYEAPVPSVNVPLTAKLALAVTDANVFNVRFMKVSVPELVIVLVPDMVMVPALGVKVPVTLKVPPTVAVAVAPVIEPLTFNPPL